MSSPLPLLSTMSRSIKKEIKPTKNIAASLFILVLDTVIQLWFYILLFIDLGTSILNSKRRMKKIKFTGGFRFTVSSLVQFPTYFSAWRLLLKEIEGQKQRP